MAAVKPGKPCVIRGALPLAAPLCGRPCARVRFVLSASEYWSEEKKYCCGRDADFGSDLFWHSRPVWASSRLVAGDDADDESDTFGSDRDQIEDDDSKEAQACFLSCLHVLCTHLRDVEEDNGDTTVWLMGELMSLMSPSFPPVALVLYQLRDQKDLTEAECACLVQCLWGLAREVVPRDVRDECVLEHFRTFLAWLVSRATDARDCAKKEEARKISIKKAAATTAAIAVSPAAANQDSSSPEDSTTSLSPCMARADTKVEKIELMCPVMMSRLEAGHAVHLRVNGELLDGGYSSGGAIQERHHIMQDAQAVDECGTKKEAERPTTFEVVLWEAAERLLLAGSSMTDLVVLRCILFYVV